MPKPELPEADASGATRGAVVEHEILFEGERADADLRPRGCAGHRPGPAIVTEFDSTTVVLPGYVAEVDRYSNLLISPEAPDDRAPQKIAEIPRLEIDPVTLDIIENALRNARYEMDAVLFRSAMSPVIREQHDEFPMITDPRGRMVVGQFGAYINEMMRDWDRGIYPGDVILTSDPYKCSASISHTNDWLVLVPIFFEDELVGWSSQFGHQMDAGGRLPGSLPTGATTIFEEGIIIPPIKLVERGEVQEDVLRLILNNVRLPEMNRADLFAIVAGCRAGERARDRALRALRQGRLPRRAAGAARPHARGDADADRPGDPRGAADVRGLDRRRRPRQRPVQDEADDLARGRPRLVRLVGDGPAGDRPVNFYLSEGMFKMFIGVYLIMVNDPQILFNDGFYPLLHVVMPEGTLLNPHFPAALGLPHARARAALRRARRRAVQAGARAQHGRGLRHLAVHALLGLGLRPASSSTRWRSSTAASRAARSATAWTATRGGRCSRTSRPSTSRPTIRCASTATRRSRTRAAPACTAAATASRSATSTSSPARSRSTTTAG